jgi:hypothetical protein
LHIKVRRQIQAVKKFQNAKRARINRALQYSLETE